MSIVNTHSHIYSEEFALDREAVLQRAKDAGIRYLLMPNIDAASISAMHSLSDQYPDYCIPMMGLHPTSVKANYQEQLDSIGSYFLQNRKYIAVGEIGIDLYWDKTFAEEQKKAFETQLQWSIDYRLPVVVHNREAFREVLTCIRNVGADKLTGVFHSFGGTREELEEILSLPHFMVGINGVVTFKNAKLDTVLDACPLNRLVVETDDPYLAPVPFRGKRNEPAYITKVVEKLAEIKGVNAQTIEQATTENACRLFRLKIT